MKINLVCKGKPISEIVELKTTLLERGCEVEIINPSFSLDDVNQDSFWEPYLSCDILWYRTGFGDATRVFFADRIKQSKLKAVNLNLIQNTLLSNKVFQNIKAQKIGIKTPKTLIGRHVYQSVAEILGDSFIVKAANGIQGNKVFLVESHEQYTESLKQISGDVLSQEFIKNTGDYRVFIIGNQVHAIFKRVPKPGDFRANISQGGNGELVTDESLRNKLETMSLAIAEDLQLDITGVDIMKSEETGELNFIEANVNPGWKGLDQALGIRTSEAVADWFMSVQNGESSAY